MFVASAKLHGNPIRSKNNMVDCESKNPLSTVSEAKKV
jgi:hypothetical protein